MARAELVRSTPSLPKPYRSESLLCPRAECIGPPPACPGLSESPLCPRRVHRPYSELAYRGESPYVLAQRHRRSSARRTAILAVLKVSPGHASARSCRGEPPEAQRRPVPTACPDRLSRPPVPTTSIEPTTPIEPSSAAFSHISADRSRARGWTGTLSGESAQRTTRAITPWATSLRTPAEFARSCARPPLEPTSATFVPRGVDPQTRRSADPQGPTPASVANECSIRRTLPTFPRLLRPPLEPLLSMALNILAICY